MTRVAVPKAVVVSRAMSLIQRASEGSSKLNWHWLIGSPGVHRMIDIFDYVELAVILEARSCSTIGSRSRGCRGQFRATGSTLSACRGAVDQACFGDRWTGSEMDSTESHCLTARGPLPESAHHSTRPSLTQKWQRHAFTWRTDGSTVGRPSQSIMVLHRGRRFFDMESMIFSPHPPGH
jgi:hypothetical protein